MDKPFNRGPLPLECIRACSRGALKLVTLLRSYGAEVDTPNQRGFTPLHKSASNGHTSCAQKLVEDGANVNVQVLIFILNRRSPRPTPARKFVTM